MKHAHRRRVRATEQRKRTRQHGNVLVVVLLILMMATSTATFVMNSTAQEQRAAGAMRNAVRVRYVAESAALTALVLAEETPVGLPMNTGTFQDWSGPRLTAPKRVRYGLPDYGNVDSLIGIDPHSYLLQSSKFTPMCTDQSDIMDTNVVSAGDSVLGGGMFALTPQFNGTSPRRAAAPSRLSPRFSSLVEMWRVTRDARPSFRYIITGFGELLDPSDAPAASGRNRQDIVSVSRAYYDVR